MVEETEAVCSGTKVHLSPQEMWKDILTQPTEQRSPPSKSSARYKGRKAQPPVLATPYSVAGLSHQAIFNVTP